jgi:hypothetical protein
MNLEYTCPVCKKWESLTVYNVARPDELWMCGCGWQSPKITPPGFVPFKPPRDINKGFWGQGSIDLP